MNRALKCASYLVGLMVLSACATVETPQQAQGMASAQDPTRIQLDQAVHFDTPDGTDVVVGPGAYRVEQATGSQLRLIPAGDAAAHLPRRGGRAIGA
jgi:hypothetical protein